MTLWLKTLAVTGLVFALGSMGSLPSAYALQLQLTSTGFGGGSFGAGTVQISDNDSIYDADSRLGFIQYTGFVGLFDAVLSIGQSKPYLGSEANPVMDFFSFEVRGGAGTLTALLTDTDFTGSGTSEMSILGGTSSGNVTYNAYIDSDNQAFGGVGTGANLLGTLGPLNGVAFSETTSGANISASLYSLTQEIKISHSGAFSVSKLDASLRVGSKAVPEPSTSLLLSMCLVSLVGYGCSCRRREQ